jgi:hypothetical protein
VVNAKFFFSELVTDCISSGNHRSLDVSIDGGKWLAAKVLGEKPAQSAVKKINALLLQTFPSRPTFQFRPCDGFGKGL